MKRFPLFLLALLLSRTVLAESGASAQLIVSITPPTEAQSAAPEPQVYIDDRWVGVAPLELTLAPGSYSLEVRWLGFYDYREEVTLRAGELRAIEASFKQLPPEINPLVKKRPYTGEWPTPPIKLFRWSRMLLGGVLLAGAILVFTVRSDE